ncbi:MAG: tRNA dihydrouridine synthase DusB [Clostridia bacterium]|nr:tRNA dihydrouridine synthase DusB [Clostridia bacterium]
MAGFMLGDKRIAHGLMLAPMAGVTDRAFRVLAVRLGAELTVSEMISAKAIWYKDKKTALLSQFSADEEPFSIQLFGNDPMIMAHAAAELEGKYPTLAAIDINMGCPMPKITGNGEGCALMRNPKLAGEIVKRTAEAIKLPVTVKIRAGWDARSVNAAYVAQTCEQNGAAMICVHGRTREQLYAPPVNRRVIADVKNAVKVPVVANGGIYTAADAVEMLEQTGCDGIAIGQGAMGNPWLFQSVIRALDGSGALIPTLDEIRDTALSHLELLLGFKGDHIGAREARCHIAYYMKGLPGAAAARDKLNRTESGAAVRALTEEFFSAASEVTEKFHLLPK